MIPADAGNLQDGTSGRSFYGQIDYLFNTGSVVITDTGVEIRVDLNEAQAVVDRAHGAKTPYRIDYVDSETGKTLTSTTLTAQAGTSFTYDKYAGDILAGVPDGYKINADQIDYDPSFINYKDPAVQETTKKPADTVSTARIKVTSRASLLNEGLTATAAADLAKGQEKAAAALKAENAATPYEIDYIDSETGEVLATTTLTEPAGTTFTFDKYAGTILAGVPDGYKLNADRIDYDPTFVNYKDPAVFKATHKKTTTVSTAHVFVTSRAAILNEGLKETAAADLYDARATKLVEGLKATAAADLYNARATKLAEGLKATAAADLYDARATKLIEGLKATAAKDLYNARATKLIEGLKATAAKDLYDARATKLAEGLKDTAAKDLANARAAKATKTTPTTTPAVKTPATKAAVTTTAAKTTAATKAAAATKALPQTGDDVNVTASALGVVAVVGALFGLAGTSLKKRA
ncbi:LPXTG cell wall anchor domain-containing protein [Lacticaseibacillus kribbianus]|uniref:LPXTG cell wall anchor domain-containing protein n=1 Tax=Lacticaseibacillus kribbianus TaxID=2926292 RepID=UPI001CD66884|nr:LPXTG cell wall anchor domain-containing protein [Lacticaseibacillus kribbianus]